MRPWGCPKCKGVESKVRQVATDGDGVPVRWRECTTVGCDGRWGSEERPISIEAFHARRRSDYDARMRRYRASLNVCTYCGRSYRRGYYMRHCATPKHKASLLHPLTEDQRRRERAKKAQAYWRRRMAA